MRSVIVDNSVWQRVGHDPAITETVTNLESRYLIVGCPPVALEFCRSARDAAQSDKYARLMSNLATPEREPTVEEVLHVQSAMRSAGIDIRQSSVADTLIAAYALVNSLEVLAADHDFEHISAALDGELRVAYVAPSR